MTEPWSETFSPNRIDFEEKLILALRVLMIVDTSVRFFDRTKTIENGNTKQIEKNIFVKVIADEDEDDDVECAEESIQELPVPKI